VSREYIVTLVMSVPCYLILHWCLARMGGVEKKTFYVVGITVFMLALNVCLGQLLGQALAAELLQFALYPVSLLLFSKSRLPRCLLASGVTLIIIVLSDQAFSAIFTAMGGSILDSGMASMFENPGLFAFIHVLLIVELAFIAFVVDRLWSIFVDKTDDAALWYFMLFPLSQGLLIYWSGSLVIMKGGETRDFVFTSLLALLCVAADFVMFQAMGQVQKKAAAEQRADFMAEQLRSQSARDALLVRDAEQASKLRHDMRNQIQVIYGLLERGEGNLAREQLKGLAELQPEREQLCENKIADTILAQKRELCEQAGIDAEFSCSVPADLPVDGVTLCSLFSNLLDNAITACSREKASWLRLKAGVQREYFIVRCENILPPPDEKKPRTSLSRHGWGLDIVREIAERFGGRVETGPAGDGYRTTVWLRLPEER
jgi:signal transduction histidine kinase